MPPSLEEDLLFGVRTHAMPLEIADADRATGSRIGGSPPIALAPETCPRCDNARHYVATFEQDVLGGAAAGQALSLLVCSGPCRNTGRAPNGGYAVVVHDPSPRGPRTSWQWAPRGRGLDAGAPTRDREIDPLAPGFMRGPKVGGQPFFVDEPIEVDDGQAFLIQLPDDVGPAETEGDYLLGGTGTVYVYGTAGTDGPTIAGASVEVELA